MEARVNDPSEARRIQAIVDFVNTNDLEGHRDALATPGELRAWLVDRGALSARGSVSAEAHARALAVREGIRALARAHNDEPLDVAAVNALNAAAGDVPLTLSVVASAEGGWSLSPVGDAADAYTGRILAAVAGAMADGSWSRVKACRNDTCRWLFHDRSRNRSGTWCTMAGCGSRMKARAYRARQRESASA
jgi:predicted RNA-binding Zn ribbon-like protein